MACGLAGGVAQGVKNVAFRSLIHLQVPDRLHGRAFAAYSGIRNCAELGAFAAGGLFVAAIGPRGTLAYAGGLSALAGVVGLLAPRRLAPAALRTGRRVDRGGKCRAGDVHRLGGSSETD